MFTSPSHGYALSKEGNVLPRRNSFGCVLCDNRAQCESVFKKRRAHREPAHNNFSLV